MVYIICLERSFHAKMTETGIRKIAEKNMTRKQNLNANEKR